MSSDVWRCFTEFSSVFSNLPGTCKLIVIVLEVTTEITTDVTSESQTSEQTSVLTTEVTTSGMWILKDLIIAWIYSKMILLAVLLKIQYDASFWIASHKE